MFGSFVFETTVYAFSGSNVEINAFVQEEHCNQAIRWFVTEMAKYL